jgi:nonsense-mediated mRNA decay protein 3
MDIELTKDSDLNAGGLSGHRSNRHVLADVWLVRSSALGTTEDHIHTRTHLGHLLKPGDTALGFDLKSANVNDPEFEKLEQKSKSVIPDVILVKKHFGDKSLRNKTRQWKLRRLEVDMASEGTTANNDFNDFMEDLEEDPISRQNVNIYKDQDKMANMMAVDVDELEDEDAPKITLQEMLDDLTIGNDGDDEDVSASC